MPPSLTEYAVYLMRPELFERCSIRRRSRHECEACQWSGGGRLVVVSMVVVKGRSLRSGLLPSTATMPSRLQTRLMPLLPFDDRVHCVKLYTRQYSSCLISPTCPGFITSRHRSHEVVSRYIISLYLVLYSVSCSSCFCNELEPCATLRPASRKSRLWSTHSHVF
jgi:hypothetical protein